MSELTLYTNPMSRGRMARWMLEEVGAPYHTVLLDYGTTMKAPEYLAINPMGKVPALVHRGVVITEVAAICAYLADAFPEAGLAPAVGDPARGTWYRWLFFGGPLEAAVSNTAMGFVVPPERKRAMGYGSLDDVADTLAQRLESSPYLAGDRFSAADVCTGSQLGYGIRFGPIPMRPVFQDYLTRITGRPAWVRATAIDDALIAGKS